MLELVAGMGFMAGPTGSTMAFLIDMEEMQILVAIAKISQIAGSRRLNECHFMAVKTQLIFRLVK